MILGFIKWVGGKKLVIDKIANAYPTELVAGRVTRYIEPFLGGGTVMLDILQKFPNVQEVFVNDLNHDLIATYEVVRDDVNSLISELTLLETSFNNLLDEKSKSDFYYDIREKYNLNRDISLNGQDKVKQAARFISLNKMCFNGLYRVNSNGDFNVPFGKKDTLKVFEVSELLIVSNLIKGVNFFNLPFEQMQQYVTANSFVYLDPPYRPRDVKGKAFTQYQRGAFNDQQQIIVRDFFGYANDIGAKVMMTNSVSSDNFLPNLYKGFNINTYSRYSGISSKSSTRGNVNEYLITNY